MIKINYEVKDNIVSELIIKGHANYDNYGKDIVCASVSTIAITTINAILTFDKNAIHYEESNGNLKVTNLTFDTITNGLLANMINLLNELTSKYPKNINMKRGE